MRTIIVGDIHGCYQKLVKLLDKVKFDRKSDRLISLGDLMDRGGQSYEVFDFFRHLKAEMGDRCIIIRGNYEDMMMNAALWSGDSPLTGYLCGLDYMMFGVLGALYCHKENSIDFGGSTC